MITVPGMFSSLAASRRTAAAPAVVGAETVTFAELYDRALRRVSELAELGVAEGSIVAVVAYNEEAIFEYLVAAGHLGAALMPLSPALPDRDLRHLLEKAEAVTCLCTPRLPPARVAELAATGIRATTIGPPRREPARDARFPTPDATCWVSTTGGSTGVPKLYAVSHERLLTNVALNAVEWGWARYGAHLAVSPLAHGIGFSHAVGQLATGGTVALVERYSPGAALEVAARTGSCWTAIVPTMLHDLLEHEERLDASVTSPDLVVSAGAPLSAVLRERALASGRRLIEYYGSTELGWVTWTEHVPGEPRNNLVGAPTLGTTVRIVDHSGAVVDDGVVGLIQKRGRPYAIPVAGGASAYHANATAWETSGDLGYVDTDGALVLAGREDDMVVVGGLNVYPVEVEAALREHPSVREALVRGEANERLGQQLTAFVEPLTGASLDADELAGFCRTRLAKYKRPARITVVAALPRNTAGKIVRTAPIA
ncbi:class I adenylate-forming enzyme family protein [Georgenia sp. AZ-5]|uniref:class I adenylate-forming enzyme family protein n=1 Tax=Georgenia sp. AZ-5 TaxID=3367526 RepID=UPI00375475F3